MLRLALLILLSYSFAAYSQDISGKWCGNFGEANLNKDIPKLKLELQISDDSITGSLTQIFSSNKYCRYVVSGYVKNNIVYLKEDSGIVHNVSAYRTLRDYKMTIISRRGITRLQGISKNYTTGIATAPSLPVWFESEISTNVESPKPTLGKSLDTMHRIMKTAVIHEITYPQKEIRIELTDNARVDNDIISLYVNNIKVINMLRLTQTPIVYNIIPMQNEKEIEITLYAENCGSMPPCTASLKITTSDTTLLSNLTSDYNVNGTIRLVLGKL